MAAVSIFDYVLLGHQLQRLESAFSSLPQVTREVIRLRRLEGLLRLEAAPEGHMNRGLRDLERATS